MTISGIARFLGLLASVLSVPLLGAGIATILRSHEAATFAVEVDRSLPPGDLRNRAATLAELCGGPDADTYAACNADVGYRLFATASVASGAGGLALLVGIALAGAVARNERRLLLALFRPGLYVTATIVTVLIVIHAVIGTVALYAGVQAVLPGTPMFFGGVILAGALAGVHAVSRALFGTVRERHVFAFGGRMTREQAPELWRLVETTATRLRALPPDGIVAGFDTNFFVTETRVKTPNGPCQGRTLVYSLPLARILTVDEFTAIIAHELGHFRGEDTLFSQHFYPIYGGTTAAIHGLAASGRGARRLALLPAIAIFGFFLDRFAVAERHHSRARELLADRAGAEATSARVTATALVKLHACAPLWPQAFEQAANSPVGDGERVPNASALFASMAAGAAGPTLLEGILETHTAHPIDTHPSLAVRLEALGVDLTEIDADALRVEPPEPAATLAPFGVTHEEALSLIASLSRREQG